MPAPKTRVVPPGSSRGLSMIEVLIALAILTLVLLTSLSVFIERQRRLRDAEETIRVWQVIANEAAFTRRVPWQALVPGAVTAFRSDLELLSGLEDVAASVLVQESGPMIREVRLRVTWRAGTRSAEAVVVRANTGGGNLW